ncbi:uncharacterized protein LOC110025295 [Phalaenopsis equestris]|uniref:uncharacterized protein LOC110025295 n=1 Tax=Phalaenopsis equestris TaxID=78828 RepID=UPI0009E23D61|nr:uncharacterized protein LOC110025295 [Phalaenopsis equestris]
MVEFDFNFDQIELDYESSALTVVNKDEFYKQKPVLKFRNKNQFIIDKKRKLEKIDEAESSNAAINRMKSIIMTSKGELVGATPTDDQPEGLELHTDVFTSSEQDDIVERVFLEQEMGHTGRLRRRTYSEPRKWKRVDCIPNSCIVNIYEAGDCIPLHVDHNDFARSFCMGNDANVPKHCIPGVLYPRVSITLRRMNEDKVPFRFRPDLEIENLRPFEL